MEGIRHDTRLQSSTTNSLLASHKDSQSRQALFQVAQENGVAGAYGLQGHRCLIGTRSTARACDIECCTVLVLTWPRVKVEGVHSSRFSVFLVFRIHKFTPSEWYKRSEKFKARLNSARRACPSGSQFLLVRAHSDT